MTPGPENRSPGQPIPDIPRYLQFGVATEPLFHFTCDCARRAIGRRGLIVPAPLTHPYLGCRVAWFTSLPAPARDDCGLTMQYTDCDRLAHRYRILQPERLRPWLGSPERAAAPDEHVFTLEAYGKPESWWISDRPVLAELDRTWTKEAPRG